MVGIQQALDQVLMYIKGIWIKKRYMIISSWLICPIGWVGVASLPDQYESSAKVYLDTNSLLRPMLQGLAFYSNPEDQVNLVARTLLSRPNLEKIARAADLDITARTPEEMEAVIDDLRDKIRMGITDEQNIYTIRYNSSTPEMSQRIVQITLNEFVESSLGSSRRNSNSAEEFLNRQIEEYEQQLKEAEQRLAEFKRKRMDRAPGDSSDYYAQIQNQKAQLKEAELRKKELLSQLDAANKQLQDVLSQDTSDVGQNIPTQYDSRIAALQSSLDELLIRYTDAHPDVIKTRALIESLEKDRQAELASIAKAASSGSSLAGMGQSPIYQQMKMNIVNLENDIAATDVRIEDYRQDLTALEEKINLVPLIEAEFQGLNRDYGVKKSKYLDLLNRKEAAELSTKIDATSDDVQFRVIEPPLLPLKPTGPQRIVYYTLILLAGFGSGLAVAFLMSQLTPVIFSPTQVTQFFNVPVLGTISHFDSVRLGKKNQRRLIVFLLSSATLLGLYGVLVVIDVTYGKIPIQILERF